MNNETFQDLFAQFEQTVKANPKFLYDNVKFKKEIFNHVNDKKEVVKTDYCISFCNGLAPFEKKYFPIEVKENNLEAFINKVDFECFGNKKEINLILL
jgi:hypothetical protein